MAVTFPESRGGTDYRTEFYEDEQVVTRVTYLFHCGVPVVNRMMCESYPSLRLGPAAAVIEGIVRDLGDGTLSFDEAMDRHGRADESRRRHDRDNAAIQELEAASSDDLRYLTWATGAGYKVSRLRQAVRPPSRPNLRATGRLAGSRPTGAGGCGLGARRALPCG